MLYSDGFFESFETMLKGGDAEEAMGRTLGRLLLLFSDMANEQGREIPPGHVLLAAGEVAQEMGVIAVKKTGTLSDKEIGPVVESATFSGVAQFLQAAEQQGSLTPEKKQQYSEMVKSLAEFKPELQSQGQSPEEAQQGVIA